MTPELSPMTTHEARAREFWKELVEKTDRTSPVEYPDMALITFDELAALLAQVEAETREALMQSILDPENQPSQFGTVTLEYCSTARRDEREACAQAIRLIMQDKEILFPEQARGAALAHAAIRARSTEDGE